jgi:hypothetical protein
VKNVAPSGTDWGLVISLCANIICTRKSELRKMRLIHSDIDNNIDTLGVLVFVFAAHYKLNKGQIL